MGNCFGSKVKSMSIGNSGLSSSGPSTSKASSTATTGKFSNMSSSTFGQSSGSGMSSGDVFPGGQILESPNLRIFTFAELKSATKNFKPDALLGEGGFGKVFKGWVDEKTLNPAKSGLGMVVAVKKLHPESMQGLEEWQSEINFLGRLSHPNLVKLMGYCWEDKELLLMYEFMAKGSLENHLFRRGAAFDPLSWSLRIKIAIGAARGLTFLHSPETQIIYRDFKASNILLDSNYNPKLSDFGLAKNGPTGEDTHVTTRVMGTYGYAAPEYVATENFYLPKVSLDPIARSEVTEEAIGVVHWCASTDCAVLSSEGDCRLTVRYVGQYVLQGKLSAKSDSVNVFGHLYVKSDVYGFGVVLVEMLSGQRALNTNRPSGQHNLVDWVKPFLADHRKLARLMDPRLEGQYPSKSAFHAAQLSLKCLASEPKNRPSMKEVLETLEQIEAMKNRSRPNQEGSSHSMTPNRSPHTRRDGTRLAKVR